jgi:predicted dehydrogenase
MNKIHRRTFAKTAAAGAATAVAARRAWGANERIRVGFIGLGNRGDQVLDGFLPQKDAEVVAICDIHAPYLDFAAKKIGGSPERYHDYRRLLDRKDIDAVVVATPDHWHALQTIYACQSGKDVYVEKPLSVCVAEGRKMVEAVHRYNRVAQVGTMRRSTPLFQEVAELIRKGGIGQVTLVRAFHVQNEWPKGIGNPPNEDPPPGFDWDAWLGPAPKRPYNKNRTFYRFRWFYDYSGGQLTNFGVHYLDMIHWALGQDAPLAVTAMGGKFAVEDNREVPDTLEVLWRYPGNTLVTFTQMNANGAALCDRQSQIEFHGTKGTVYLLRNGYELVPELVKSGEFPVLNPLDRTSDRGYRKNAKAVVEPRKGKSDGKNENETPRHVRNFLDCVRSRQRCNCDIETGHRDTSAAILGNIAHRTKAYLEWDAKLERFTNHRDANQYLRYDYRKPYDLPT